MSNHSIKDKDSLPCVEKAIDAEVESDTPLADDGSKAPQQSASTDLPNYPGSWRFAIIMTCAGSSAFLVGYDSNCVATIIPVLIRDFHAIEDMVWYSTSYLITSTASVLSLGKVYNLYPFKPVFTFMLAIFLVGSIICTVAQNSLTFIFGRAITGLASAGILSGMNILISRIAPLEKRPFWQGVVGMAECVAICAGPLIGGVLTNYGGWRSCFYVTIPIAVLSLVMVLFLFRDIETPTDSHLSLSEKLSRCDPLGVALLMPAIICLVLALQWAGNSYKWTNFRVLLPLLLVVPLAGGFIGCQIWRGEKATISLRLLRSRTMIGCVLYSGFMSASLYLIAFYIPLWFQTAREKSAFVSGVSTLPLVIGLSIAILFSGFFTSYIGYYTPALILGSCLLSIGAGLMTTLSTKTPTVEWAVYQIIYGIGCGLGWQAPYIAVQTVLVKEDITPGIVFVVFSFTLGGIIAMAVGQNIYLARLLQLIRPMIPSITPQQINREGMSGLIEALGADSKESILEAYNDAVMNVLYSAIAVSCASLLCAFCIEVKSVKIKTERATSNTSATQSE